jgi:hypothetical protein
MPADAAERDVLDDLELMDRVIHDLINPSSYVPATRSRQLINSDDCRRAGLA